MSNPTNPLLVQFDQAIHAVTEKHRKAHPSHWFEVKTCKVVERSKAPAPKATTAPKDTLAAAYLKELDEVTQRFNRANPDWFFSVAGVKVTALMKPGSISHNTRPLSAQAVPHVAND